MKDEREKYAIRDPTPKSMVISMDEEFFEIRK